MNRKLFYKPMHFCLQMAVADKVFIMLLLLTAVTQHPLTLTDSTLSTEQLHTVLCLRTVAHRDFAPANSLVFSNSRTSPDVASSPLSDPLSQTDDLHTASVLLGKLYGGTRRPIELFRPGGEDTADRSVLRHNYILFVWNGEAGSLNETLENQLENLKDITSWNPRARFLLLATESSNEPAQLLAAHVSPVLWQVARFVNAVVLIPNQFSYLPLHVVSRTKAKTADRLNLYARIPFKLET